MGKIKVLQPGIQSTLQDEGRHGYQSYGISVGGSMSTYLSRLANILVGNKPGAPVLEMIQSPHQFLFEEDKLVSFCGGGLIPEINGTELTLFEPVIIDAGTVVHLKKPAAGFRLYMAVAGGFAADNFLNSYSTNLLTGSGGYGGSVLKKNDVLAWNELSQESSNIKKLLKKNFYFKLDTSLLPDLFSKTIRIIKGAEYELLTETSKTSLETQSFKLTNDHNRMGYRLKSDALELKEKKEMISTAVCKGTIQLLPGGQTIALMADCQTVGGYPRIAKIAEADLVACSQLKPGDEINFSIISLAEAEQLYLAQEQQLQQIQDKVHQLFL